LTVGPFRLPANPPLPFWISGRITLEELDHLLDGLLLGKVLPELDFILDGTHNTDMAIAYQPALGLRYVLDKVLAVVMNEGRARGSAI